jgi:hypothetical protein
MTGLKNSAVLTTGGGALPELPDELADLAAADGPQGVSQAPADQLLAMITTLQPNSSRVNKRSPDYLPDAEAGSFHFRGAAIEVRDGVTGFQCVVCHYGHLWNEWGPVLGAGLQAVHLERPADAVMRTVADADKPQWVRPGSGNVLQDCRQLIVLVTGKAYMMPFHGSGHAVVRQLQTLFNQFTHPKTGRPLPVYAHKFQVKSVARSNSKGHWFLPSFVRLGFTTLPEYQAGRELYRVVQRGAYRLEAFGPDAADSA